MIPLNIVYAADRNVVIVLVVVVAVVGLILFIRLIPESNLRQTTYGGRVKLTGVWSRACQLPT